MGAYRRRLAEDRLWAAPPSLGFSRRDACLERTIPPVLACFAYQRGGVTLKRLTIGAVVTLSLVLVASAGAAVFTIHGDWRMGSFKVKRDGTLRGAIDAFGPTGSRDRNGEVCTSAGHAMA